MAIIPYLKIFILKIVTAIFHIEEFWKTKAEEEEKILREVSSLLF